MLNQLCCVSLHTLKIPMHGHLHWQYRMSLHSGPWPKSTLTLGCFHQLYYKCEGWLYCTFSDLQHPLHLSEFKHLLCPHLSWNQNKSVIWPEVTLRARLNYCRMQKISVTEKGILQFITRYHHPPSLPQPPPGRKIKHWTVEVVTLFF